MGDLKTADDNYVDELFIAQLGLAADQSLEISFKPLISLQIRTRQNRDGVLKGFAEEVFAQPNSVRLRDVLRWSVSRTP